MKGVGVIGRLKHVWIDTVIGRREERVGGATTATMDGGLAEEGSDCGKAGQLSKRDPPMAMVQSLYCI